MVTRAGPGYILLWLTLRAEPNATLPRGAHRTSFTDPTPCRLLLIVAGGDRRALGNPSGYTEMRPSLALSELPTCAFKPGE
ncbi:hypothetical protein AGOR_G00016400 [Albula goreensis]|uniref:Uncharacterized protein n=1 Tax=Albula goreensis TaxID=1534307 RepID=A0A8T3ECG8_9TELE|nr:hypothetical protein AGOR_G00016400 [Albula goreensis]